MAEPAEQCHDSTRLRSCFLQGLTSSKTFSASALTTHSSRLGETKKQRLSRRRCFARGCIAWAENLWSPLCLGLSSPHYMVQLHFCCWQGVQCSPLPRKGRLTSHHQSRSGQALLLHVLVLWPSFLAASSPAGLSPAPSIKPRAAL